jgi:hypothetical protein
MMKETVDLLVSSEFYFSCFFHSQLSSLIIYIYIYIYLCVCVCVCFNLFVILTCY